MSGNSAEIKTLLTAIRNNDYCISEIQEYFVLSHDHLRSPDPGRDELIYDIIANWIEADLLDAGQLKQILDVCLEARTCFTTSANPGPTGLHPFVLRPGDRADHQRPPETRFLSSSELHQSKTGSRIPVPGAGFAGIRGRKRLGHAVAHAADVLDELAQCPELSDPGDMLGILSAIKLKVETDYYAYIHEEDERMVTVVVHVMARKVLEDRDIVQWLDSFQATRSIARYPEGLYLRANVKSFFRSLYLRLSKIDDMSP